MVPTRIAERAKATEQRKGVLNCGRFIVIALTADLKPVDVSASAANTCTHQARIAALRILGIRVLVAVRAFRRAIPYPSRYRRLPKTSTISIHSTTPNRESPSRSKLNDVWRPSV